MDIFLIAPAFQPYCPVAATRPAAFARYLIAQGHSVRVLAAHNRKYEPVTDPGIDATLITYAPMWHAEDVASKILHPFRKKPTPSAADIKTVSAPARVKSVHPLKLHAYDAFDYLVNYPDSYMGWIKNAKQAGAGLIGERRPDVIFSTAPPHSANVVASDLARRFDVPWVCEYRDLWMDHPYHIPGRVRRFFENRLETRSLKEADALVAVSADARAVMDARFEAPAILAYNGYDPDMFAGSNAPAPLHPDRLTLIYAGSIYVRTRSPEPLFDAMRGMGLRQDQIEVQFYGGEAGIVQAMAERAGVSDMVTVHPPRPQRDILDLERRADVLFLMRWDDPREDGVIPGKVFEYIGARRPILSIGRTGGEVAGLLSGRLETYLVNQPNDIQAALARWLKKRQAGRLPDVTWGGADRFTRTAQFAKIEALLLERA